LQETYEGVLRMGANGACGLFFCQTWRYEDRAESAGTVNLFGHSLLMYLIQALYLAAGTRELPNLVIRNALSVPSRCFRYGSACILLPYYVEKNLQEVKPVLLRSKLVPWALRIASSPFRGILFFRLEKDGPRQLILIS